MFLVGTGRVVVMFARRPKITALQGSYERRTATETQCRDACPQKVDLEGSWIRSYTNEQKGIIKTHWFPLIRPAIKPL